jgi:hypothetical protein
VEPGPARVGVSSNNPTNPAISGWLVIALLIGDFPQAVIALTLMSGHERIVAQEHLMPNLTQGTRPPDV